MVPLAVATVEFPLGKGNGAKVTVDTATGSTAETEISVSTPDGETAADAATVGTGTSTVIVDKATVAVTVTVGPLPAASQAAEPDGEVTSLDPSEVGDNTALSPSEDERGMMAVVGAALT